MGDIGTGMTIAIVIKAIDEFSKTMSNVEASTKALGKKYIAMGVAIAGAGVAGVLALGDMAISAAKAQDVQDAFNKSLGSDGINILNAYKEATLGSITNTEMMMSINKALARGIKAENVPAFAEYAQRALDAGIATGTVTDVIDQMTRAMATGRTGMLKSIGITIDEDTALKNYASTQLTAQAAMQGLTTTYDLNGKAVENYIKNMTDSEILEANKIGILEGVKKATEKLPKPTKDMADMVTEATTAFTNLKEQLGEQLLPIFTWLVSKITSVITWFSSLSNSTKKIIAITALVVFGLMILAGVILILTGLTMAFTAVNIWWIAIILLVIAAIAGIIAIIVYWKEILMWFMGIFIDVAKWILLAWEKVKDGWEVAWTIMKNVMITIWNLIMTAIETYINLIIAEINLLIDGANDRLGWLGISIEKINNISLGGLKGELTDIGALIERQRQEAEAYSEALDAAGEQLKGQIASKINYQQETAQQKTEENVNVNIEGNVYGTDPDEMSQAIFDKLKNKIAL